MGRRSEKRAARPRVILARTDVAPKTAGVYAKLLMAFNTYLVLMGLPAWEVFAEISSPDLLLWAGHFLQLCYDQQVFGRSEAGLFISALRRGFRILVAEGNPEGVKL